MKLLTLLMLFSICCDLSAQSKDFVRFNQNNDSLETIDRRKFDSILSHSEAKCKLVFVYTNHCSGTHFILKDIPTYTLEYGNQLCLILVSSERYKEIPLLRKILNKYSIKLPKTYIVDSDVYKDRRFDSRVKGYKFRNDICRECKNDIIGVPYCLLYGAGNKLIFHGYRSDVNFDSLLNAQMNR